MIKNPDPESLDFQLLVLHVYNQRVLTDVQEGLIPPPEDLVNKALRLARQKFETASKTTIFEEIIVCLAECRQLLFDLQATFADIGVTQEEVRAIEKRLPKIKTKDKNKLRVVSGHSEESCIAICCHGNQRFLRSE